MFRDRDVARTLIYVLPILALFLSHRLSHSSHGAGKYGDQLKQIAVGTGCKICGAGNYSSTAGVSKCTKCGFREYSTGDSSLCTLCGEGETTVDKGSSICVCRIGFFADPSAESTSALHGCTECPPGFKCDRAGVVLKSANLMDGFWRSDVNSTRALPCPSRESCNRLSSSDGCNGSSSSSRDSCNVSSSAAGGGRGCAPGHEGPFCSLCSPSYTRFSDAGLCQSCPSNDDELSATAVLVVIIVGFFVIVALYALFNHKVPKGLLKPFINGMQYLAIVMTSSTAKRPKIVEDVLKALSVLSFDFDIMSLSCLVRYMDAHNMLG